MSKPYLKLNEWFKSYGNIKLGLLFKIGGFYKFTQGGSAGILVGIAHPLCVCACEILFLLPVHGRYTITNEGTPSSLIYHNAVCRTAHATPGLSINISYLF